MFKKSDPNTYTKFCSLSDGTNTIGTLGLEYQVVLYEDVQAKDSTSVYRPLNQKFIVYCTERINIYNPNSQNLLPTTDLAAYSNYPAMINATMYIDQPDGVKLQIIEYSPETINTQIDTSGTTGSETGVTKESSNSRTSGSSISQTNSYGGSVTVGDTFSGASASYEHSSTVMRENSNTNSASLARSNSSNFSKAASMSIKDWGAYGLINPNTIKPSWTFGQEYPWDAITCKDSTGETNPDNTSQVQIVIPTSMQVCLYDGVTLYPPSELSRFGINFVMKASWIVVMSNELDGDISMEHVINYFSASHTLSGSTVSVYIDEYPTVLQVPDNQSLSTTFNLNIMALDSLSLNSPAAIIGFIPGKFINLPVAATADTQPVAFKIVSGTNDLLIKDTTTYPDTTDAGAGFTASQTSLTGAFAENCTSLQMTMYFKVIDSVATYNLYLKHWKTGATGVMLTMIMNEDTANPIVKYVDALEAEGGENNLLTIALRNQDFTSVDYHDYLQLGLNSIQITIQPVDDGDYASCGYQVRAVSIESE
ncbi:MAG TPA: hypothetical protein VK826_18890 [Bacteroidia bacterium]|nr:hypothetical protein [Bacteroidia bacterium]